MAILISHAMPFGSPPRWRRAIVASSRLLCGLLLFLALAPAHAGPSEYEVKTAFIHNIARFVEWPAAPRTPGILKLCVLGQNPFGNALDALRGKQIEGLNWEVVSANSKTDLRECGALFIAASESGNLRQILDDIKDSSVLTLGDTDSYAEQGVMVNFYLADNKVRFKINLESASRAGLKVSSKLIQVGTMVYTPNDHGTGYPK